MPADRVFVDTGFLVALTDPDDQHVQSATLLAARLFDEKRSLVTTDDVLVELGNFFSRSRLRERAIRSIGTTLANPDYEVVHVDSALFQDGLARYRRFKDKSWSMTDCISMEVMRRRRIREVATADSGFEQAGFTVLMG